MASYIYCYLYFNDKKVEIHSVSCQDLQREVAESRSDPKGCVLSTTSLGSTVNSDGHGHAYIFTTAA